MEGSGLESRVHHGAEGSPKRSDRPAPGNPKGLGFRGLGV